MCDRITLRFATQECWTDCDFISRYYAQLIANRFLHRYSWRSHNVVRPWTESLRRQSNDPNRFIVRDNSRDVYAASASLRLPARGWKWRDLSERIGARSERVYRRFIHRHFFRFFVSIRSLQVERATYNSRSREANTLNEIITDSHSLFDFEFAGRLRVA